MPNLKFDTPLNSIKGLSAKTLEKLEKIGIMSVHDLLWHTPIRCEDWGNPTPISDLTADNFFVVRGMIEKVSDRRLWARRLAITEAVIKDYSGKIRVIWFNQAYVKRSFNVGDEIIISGKTSFKKGLFFSNPSSEVIKDGFIPQIVPIYRRPKGLSSKAISGIIKGFIPFVEDLQEFIPQDVLSSQKIPEINQALKTIHSPDSLFEWYVAKKRFSFESLFLIQLNCLIQKKKLLEMDSPAIPPEIDFLKKTMEKLPFELTFAQKRVLWEILKDMELGRPMNRLLQGDVGSGKTIIAGLAALEVIRHGYQVAIMAPTEILANQHYETIKKFFGYLNIPLALITSKNCRISYEADLESKPKKIDVLRDIKKGELKIVIGTHSLISNNKKIGSVAFEKLGLVIIDEQHRFGVDERARLADQGRDKKYFPHFLSMSATPIPRTLAIALFGDLDLSIIDELPKNRKPITTKIVSQLNRNKAYDFIRSQIKEGRQAFVVCPRIEEVESEEIESFSINDSKTVTEEYRKLSKVIFPDLNIAMLHGRMKSEEKSEIMTDFKNKKYDLLISTSVIEVGVDVPNATIMMIENADRFGLAQLYQFRGRVGRGEHQSYCLIFSDSDSPEVAARLEAIRTAKNGLELAEKDLLLRGPGEFLGSNQKGVPDSTMKALQNPEIIKASREAALNVINGKVSFQEFAILKSKIDQIQKDFHLE